MSFWAEDVLRPLGWAALATVVFLVSAPRDQRLFYGLLWAGLAGASYASRLHSGGYVNVLLPSYAGLALGFALGIRALEPRANAHGIRASALLWLAVGFQFASLLYNPRVPLPTSADRAAGDGLVASISTLPGRVWIPSHDYLARRAGKLGHAHEMALVDVYRGDPQGEGGRLLHELEAAVKGQRFGAIVVSSDGAYQELVQASYTRTDTLLRGNMFWTVTGKEMRPEWVYRPRPGAEE